MHDENVLGFPLSPQQSRLWRLQGGPDPGPFRAEALLHLAGPVDAAALRRALDAVVARQEILRTAFQQLPGMSLPLQVILDPRPAGLAEPPSEPAFAPDRGEVLHLSLLEAGPDACRLRISLPALCADAAALESLAVEIAAGYAVETGQGEEGEPPIQYADLAAWQNELLESPETAAGLDRWREDWREHSLNELIAAPLPFARETTEGPFQPDTVPVPVDLPAAAVQGLLAAWECPAPVLFLALWQMLLRRSTDRSEVLVGLLRDGRIHEELRSALGPFARYVPVIGRIDGDMLPREIARKAREAFGEASKRQLYFSWEQVAGPSGFFPACFSFEEPWEHQAAGLRLTLEPRSAVVDRFGLELSCARQADGSFRLALRHDASRIPGEGAALLAERMATLIASVLAQPELALERHELLGTRERERILAGLDPAPAGPDACLHRLFAEQAARTPDREAVAFQGESLTYGELDRRANRLAHHLRALGIGIETPIAIFLERSLETVVAILGVLKAGGAWLPLDPSYPRERIAAILEDSGAPWILTREPLLPLLPAGNPARRVLLDAEAPALAARPDTEPSVPALPGSLAYLIYTSGSTGRPKGVCVEHRAPLNLLAALRAAALDQPPFQPGEPLRASLNAPFAFDASVQQLALLLAGHTLEIVPEEVRTDGGRFLAFLAERRLDLLDCTPSQLRLLLEAGLLETPGAVPRAVFAAGEAIDSATWNRLAASRRTVFYNIYGPTECTVDATARRIDRPGAPTLGRPLAGYEAWVLDREQRPVPIGALGEICLGGAGLARGYAGRPEATAERFVPHPFSRRPGARLYRTGDLARLLPGGEIEFAGRIDHQVKIRGYRIEPGEIEAVLRTHPGVAEAVVVPRRLGEEVSLVAYVRTAAEATAAPIQELQRLLREKLPVYMVPAGIVPLDAFPATPNGKVDRKALAEHGPAPEALREGSAEAVPPRNPIEELIAGIWREVLGAERVGIHDNFFDLGGHSLLATRLVSRLNAVFEGAFSIRQLFDRPTVAGLAGTAEAVRQTPAPPITPAPRDRALPLSFPQLRLWFLDQLEPGSPAYNLPTAVRLQGPLRADLLRTALSEVVRRHEALRTTFHATPAGEPVQVIAPAAEVELPRIDLAGLPAAERESELHRLAREEAWRPFDLARGPLLRARLAVLGTDEHAAFLSLHHIVGDGWSSAVLIRELGTVYSALAQGLPWHLPDLPIQYADFAGWQRQWLTGGVLDDEIAFWRSQLGGIPPALDLPADHPRPPLPTFRGASCPVRIPATLAAGLESLARRQGATLFMTLLAGFQGLLGRTSGQEAFAVGTPVAGRNRLQTEDLIGLFINMLVLRADLAGDPPGTELVVRTRETALAAYAHQDLPFEKLVEELQPARNLSHAPLFQVAFVLQNVPVSELRFPGLLLTPFFVESGTAKHDLTLILEPTGDGGLAGVLEHALDLFETVTAERTVAHLLTLLAGLAAAPERRLSDLPLLSPGEQAQLLAEWTGARLDPAWDGPVHELVARAAARHPDAPALLFEGETVSYAELRRRASSLAARLAALGVGPEIRVALIVEPSPEMIVGLLGVLEAGGVYVPLDPGTPPERLAWLLADAEAPLLLTQERFRAALAPQGARLLCLDSLAEGEETAGHGRVPVAQVAQVAQDRAAYLIYTSGSTGQPKGVVAPHGGLASFTRAMAAALGLGPGDRMLQFASLSFDASAVQIFPTLASGAALVLHPNPRGLSPAGLLDLCVRTGVTVLDLPAALWRQWVAAMEAPDALAQAPIRAYLTGGEAVPTAVLRDWADRSAPGALFLSSYGPTETTVTTTVFLTRREDVAELTGSEIPLGRPLPGTRVALLDRHGQPVPPGAPGELYIGGAGVTRGYLHRPGLTAERYVPDPLSGEPGARLYRTGDLARLRSGGELEFLGRADHQVKVRGYRIELGEIEFAFGTAPGVREAAVTLHEEGGDRRLIAWVLAEPEAEPTEEALLAHLREVLPAYMVPSRVAVLSELPLTPSGKVDRKALAHRGLPGAPHRVDGRGEPVPPRTVTELVLAQMFEELLGVKPVGADDDFFALGGHSLLSVRLMARIRHRFGRDLPLAELFTHPTVAALALRLEEEGGTPWSPLVALQPRGTGTPLFCVHPIGGEVLCYSPLARRLGEDRPLYGLQARPLSEQAGAPQPTLEEMAAEYLAEVRRVQPAGPYLLAGLSFGGVVAFEMAQQLRRAGEEVALLALLDAAVPPGDEAAAFDSAAVIAGLLRQQARAQGHRLPLEADTLRGLPLDGQLALALEALGGTEALGPGIDLPLLRRLVLGYAARMAAVERYKASPSPEKIVVIRPLDQDPADLQDTSPERRRVWEDPSLGWNALAAGGVEIHRVPGYHETMTAEPNVETLAGVLRACIASAETLLLQVENPREEHAPPELEVETNRY